ncbi:DUF2339 domain-containing protein [Baia soyae]|uniref:Putative membrane protein DUF2339 n=1 Tax=Baia soyae TaxID=1544746 RepID=A0A4R2RTN3_9BACL|nr:DUF2339 domain-containing protein [Baia soyae]TCP66259.1 putative membrane protein DUF2339 [Baia soyae]
MPEFLLIVVMGLAIWIGIIRNQTLHRDRELLDEIRSLQRRVLFLESTLAEREKQHQEEAEQATEYNEMVELPKNEEVISERLSSSEEEDLSPQVQEPPLPFVPEPIIFDSSPPPVKEKSRTRHEWEMLIGGTWLNRIGALAIIFGMIFFYKYAVDHDWVSETMQVCLGYLVAGMFTWMGVRTHKKGLPIFAQGILGTAIAVSYTTSFAAYEFYHLIPMMVGFAFMSVVTIGAFWIGFRYSSIAIVLLGWFGGFATPFLIHSDQGSTIGLFSYLGILTLGVLILVSRRSSWWVLQALSFGAVHLMLLIWALAKPYGEERALHVSLACLYWLIFVGFEYLMHQVKKWKTAYDVTGYLIPLFLLLEIGIMEDFRRNVVSGIVLLLGSVVYLWFMKQNQASEETAFNRIIRWELSPGILGFLGLVQFFSGSALVIAWSLCGLSVIWYGVKHTSLYSLILGTVQFFSIFLYFYNGIATPWMQGELYRQWVDVGLLGIFAGILYVVANWMSGIHRWKWLEDGYHIAWSVVVVAFFSEKLVYGLNYVIRIQSDNLFRSFYAELIGLLWLGLAVLYSMFSRRKKQLLLFDSWVWFLAGLSMVVLVPELTRMLSPSVYMPIFNIRTIISVISMLLVYLLYRNRMRHRFMKGNRWISHVLSMIMVIIPFEWLTVETINYFWIQALEKGANLAQIGYLENQTLSIGWTLFAIGLTWLNGKIRSRFLQIVTWIIIVGSSFFITCCSVVVASIEQFVPVFNLRFISFFLLSIALFLQIWWRDSWRDWIPKKQSSFFLYGFIFTIVFVLFELVTVEVSNTFSHLISLVPNGEEEKLIQLANMSRLAISLAWLIFACLLLWMGVRQKIQKLRLTAFGLMALAILKIFLFDLSFLNSLYRTLSLIVLGIILLSVSYLYQKKKHWFISN